MTFVLVSVVFKKFVEAEVFPELDRIALHGHASGMLLFNQVFISALLYHKTHL